MSVDSDGGCPAVAQDMTVFCVEAGRLPIHKDRAWLLGHPAIIALSMILWKILYAMVNCCGQQHYQRDSSVQLATDDERGK